jgi:hypothetical protein
MLDLVERATDDLMRGIAGMIGLTGLLVLQVVLDLVFGNRPDALTAIVTWAMIAAYASIAAYMSWLAATGRAMKPRTPEHDVDPK